TGVHLNFAANLSNQPGPAQDALLAERIATLEKYVGQLDADIDLAHREIDQQGNDLRRQIKAEVEERKQRETVLNRDLTEVAAGNYAVLVFGAVWLCVGIIITTLPDIINTLSG
ncbi:MAG: hypothetical protein ACREAC_21825, partial [Blastocatellia bacterium]